MLGPHTKEKLRDAEEIAFHRVRGLAIAVGALAERLMGHMAGLSVSDSRVLLAIGKLPHATATEISRSVALTPVQVGRSVAKLRQERLLSVSPDVSDARALRLSLTSQGNERLATARHTSRAVEEWAIRSLSEEEWKIFSDILNRLIETAEFSETDVANLEDSIRSRLRLS